MNKVILMGRAGADPEVREGTVKVVSFRLATSYYKTGGEQVTEWHSIKVFGKIADTVERYVRKGARVLVEGRVHTEKYNEQYWTDIIVEKLEIVDFPPKEEMSTPVDDLISEIVNDPSLQPRSVREDPLLDIPF